MSEIENQKPVEETYSASNIQVLEGLEDYIVAEKGGRLLVCRLSNEQKIKEFQK